MSAAKQKMLSTTEVNGSGTLTGFGALTEGDMVAIEVAHDAFNWAEPPRFADADGAIFLFDASYSNAARFRIIVMRTETAGAWSGGTGNLAYSWTRRGGKM